MARRKGEQSALGGSGAATPTEVVGIAGASREGTTNSATGESTKLLHGTYPKMAKLPEGCRPRVLILPARDEPDELAGRMLGHVLAELGFDTSTVGIASLAGEMVETAIRTRPDLIVVSATPPAAVAHARYLLKRLDRVAAEGGENVVILTVLWTRSRELRRLTARLGRGDVPVATTLLSATQAVVQLTHPCVQKWAAKGEAEAKEAEKVG